MSAEVKNIATDSRIDLMPLIFDNGVILGAYRSFPYEDDP
jgi:hypothetical protein